MELLINLHTSNENVYMYAYTSGLFEESTARMKIVVIQHKKLDEESNDIGK